MPYRGGMGRSAEQIQREIDQIEAVLYGSDATVASAGANGVNAARVNYADLTKRLDLLYRQLGRANGTRPMFGRGRLKDMGHGR